MPCTLLSPITSGSTVLSDLRPRTRADIRITNYWLLIALVFLAGGFALINKFGTSRSTADTASFGAWRVSEYGDADRSS